MTYLWAKVMRKHRIERSETIELTEDILDALTTLCTRMDIPRPMLLPKHEREWDQFRQMHFLPEHFVEEVPFDRLELEAYDPNARKSRSMDPRNG